MRLAKGSHRCRTGAREARAGVSPSGAAGVQDDKPDAAQPRMIPGARTPLPSFPAISSISSAIFFAWFIRALANSKIFDVLFGHVLFGHFAFEINDLQRDWACAGNKLRHSTAGDQKLPSRTFRLKNMARSPSAFRQTDITKALKAVRAAGYGTARVQIDRNGKIDITTMTESEAQTDAATSAEDADDADLDRELTDWEQHRGR